MVKQNLLIWMNLTLLSHHCPCRCTTTTCEIKEVVNWCPKICCLYIIQQDNAKTHVAPNDPAFIEAVEATGLDIRLLQQPPNSPDLNVLDLGFFNSIQSLTDRRSPKIIDDIIRDVEEEFEGYDVADLNRVFLSLWFPTSLDTGHPLHKLHTHTTQMNSGGFWCYWNAAAFCVYIAWI